MERLAAITTPILVINSEDSDSRLQTWARGVANALPDARHRSLKGQWHSAPDEVLAPALTEFFTGH